MVEELRLVKTDSLQVPATRRIESIEAAMAPREREGGTGRVELLDVFAAVQAVVRAGAAADRQE